MKALCFSAILFLLAFSALNSGFSESGNSLTRILKGRSATNILGYPAAYGNEPFVSWFIRGKGDPFKTFYIIPDQQKKIAALPYGLYRFDCFIFWKSEWKNLCLTNQDWYRSEAAAFDAIMIPKKWKLVR